MFMLISRCQDLKANITGRQWRTREASCLALTEVCSDAAKLSEVH